MNKILSRLYSLIRKEVWTLDPKIGNGYLIMLMVSVFKQCVRGYFVFRKSSLLIRIGKKVQILDRRRIIFKGNVSIGDYSYIDALSSSGLNFGRNVTLGRYTTIVCTGSLTKLGEGMNVGNNVGLGANCFFGAAGGINIGDDTIFGNFVSLHSENHNFSDVILPIRLQGVSRLGIRIGNNCWIGAKSTILDGVEIGNNTIVAAGAVVTEGIYPSDVILGGVPARVLKKLYG
jgi:acetyltransferase-like isoleucine patch superfamily enzyme